MSKIKISFSFSKLHEFEYIEKGSQMPNVQAKLYELIGKEVLDSFLTEYIECHVNKYIGDGEITDIAKFHAISTLILNAKKHIIGMNDSFGMEYFGMVCVTYHNNSNPNILEFFIVKE